MDPNFVEATCDNGIVSGYQEVWPAIADLCVEFSVQGYNAIQRIQAQHRQT
jgi:hypothetical protein